MTGLSILFPTAGHTLPSSACPALPKTPQWVRELAVYTLLGQPWPGNVRELDHAIERAVLMAQGSVVKYAPGGV
jgi:DNA-binding NtrC family response regulator